MSSIQMSRRTSSKPVSRMNAPKQRSMFARPENAEQQQYAFARQAGNYRHAANQVNPLQRPVNRRQQTFAGTAFGGNQVPGQTEIAQPNSRMINAQTGRTQSQQYQPGSVGGSRRVSQMSMAQMNDFIRRQPGGKAFMEDSDRFNGGRFNFDQSLSRTGAGMAQRGGALPPELQQMAIPFKPSQSAAKINLAREQVLRQTLQQQQQKRKPQTWYDSQQAQMISGIVTEEHHETQMRSQRHRQDAQMSEAMSMGVRYQPSSKAQPSHQQQQQQRMQQQKAQQQQQQGVQQQSMQRVQQRPPQVRAPPSRVERRQDIQGQRQQEPSRYDSDSLDQRFADLGIEGKRGSQLTRDTYAARTERPSRLFSQNVSSIQQSVNHTMYVNQLDQEEGKSNLPMLPVTALKRKTLQKEEHIIELPESERALSSIELEKLRIQEQQKLEEQRRIAILKATGREDVLEREAQRETLAQEYDNAPKQGEVEFIVSNGDKDEGNGMSAIEAERARLQQLQREQEEHRWKVLNDTGRAQEVKQLEQQHQEDALPERRVRFADEHPDQFYTDEQHLRQEDDMLPDQEIQTQPVAQSPSPSIEHQ